MCHVETHIVKISCWIIQELENVFVKHYAPNYMLSLKHASTIIPKHQKHASSKVDRSDKN